MESILAIDLKNNPEILEDFEGIEPGDKVKITAEYTVSELSVNRASLPLDSVSSISLIGSDDDDTEEDDSAEEEAEEAGS